MIGKRKIVDSKRKLIEEAGCHVNDTELVSFFKKDFLEEEYKMIIKYFKEGTVNV